MSSLQLVRSSRYHSLVVAAALAAAVVVASSGCGSDDASVSPDVDVAVSCEDDFDELIALLRSGVPTYDYDPATDLADLVDRTDAALTGTIESVVRTLADEPNEAGDNSWTTMSLADVKLLDGQPAAPATRLAQSSLWALRDEPDPLEDPVKFTGLGFVAFVHESPNVPGGLSVDVQGLFVSCTQSPGPPTAILEPLPGDAEALSLAELAEAVSAAD